MTPLEYWQKAKEDHEDLGVLEIDDFQEDGVSLSEGGAYVKAWIWIADPSGENTVMGTEEALMCGEIEVE